MFGTWNSQESLTYKQLVNWKGKRCRDLLSYISYVTQIKLAKKYSIPMLKTNKKSFVSLLTIINQ